MDISSLKRLSAHTWEIPRRGKMRVPAIIHASEELLRAMDDKVAVQAANVATLPGIVGASHAMPDAHRGHGFPAGGVAAFDADAGGVVAVGGVGFDVACGIRCLHTGLRRDEVMTQQKALADKLYHQIPLSADRGGRLHLSPVETERMLRDGARWAVERGYGRHSDLERIEAQGCVAGAVPDSISAPAKLSQQEEMGTLGGGDHYLEVQAVSEVFDSAAAEVFGLHSGDVVVSIHCGSRGLGRQIGSEFLKQMAAAAPGFGIALPEPELACAPIRSALGEQYLGAMRAAANSALANRQVITHLVRQVFGELFAKSELPLLYDASHNTCQLETHVVNGVARQVYVHRRGASRAFGPGHEQVPAPLRAAGQPVMVGGSVGTGSYMLAGCDAIHPTAFASACHGAGRAVSRQRAMKMWKGREIIEALAARGILFKSPSLRGVSAEAPGAYRDLEAVVDAADAAGLARKVARLEPLICVKG
ncbi:MAG: RtcB family protein [Exilibacterium sp.]